MAIPAHDYDYLLASLQEMEDYLASDVLFWRISPGSYPGDAYNDRLTIGGNLFSLKRLEVELPESQLMFFRNRLMSIRDKWQKRWQEKTEHEFRSRFRQWGIYLNECFQDPEDHVPYYSYEVRRRVILRLLGEDRSDFPASLLHNLREWDRFLRLIFDEAAFLWAPELEAVFSRETDWYLFGAPAEEKIEDLKKDSPDLPVISDEK
jgi:hypothetical protein